MRKHPDDFDDQNLDRYADRDDEGLEELGTAGLAGQWPVGAGLAGTTVGGWNQVDVASTLGLQPGAGRAEGPTACLVRSRAACSARRIAAGSDRSARAVRTGRIRKLGCSTQVGT